ncbi:MAG: hypothetical protein NTW87_21980, partial [Planctomycetota bacterium]|nr:hypothetical protein [Planctomycetota bacterium]
LRVGLQSVAKGFDGIPFLAEFGGGSVRVLGPLDLFTHTSFADGDKKGQAPLKLEVKAEKDAPDFIPGQYTLKLHREGTALGFKLTGPQGFASVSVEIKDLNLSNWVFKNTQLIVRQPPQGLQIAAAEVRRRYGGGELGEALRHFREGEYSVSETESKVIAAGERGETHYQKARALFQLGLIQEICQPASGRERGFYADALTELGQVAPDEARTPEKAQEQARLATELHFRRLLRFAKDRKWPDVTNELYLGWSQENHIGEPLAWELHKVLELALQTPAAKDAAAKDTERAQAIQAALQVFERLGLETGSARFGKWAGELAAALAARGDEDPPLRGCGGAVRRDAQHAAAEDPVQGDRAAGQGAGGG